MLNSIKNFFNQYLLPEELSSTVSSENALQIATAALLIEIIHADDEIKPIEMERTLKIIRSTFSLRQDEADELILIAKQQVSEATDYYQFTHLINQHYSQQQKVRIVEGLWKVAFSDNELDQFEEYAIRKIADLLHLNHGQYIETKLKTQRNVDSAKKNIPGQ